jgi:hypothetical protein
MDVGSIRAMYQASNLGSTPGGLEGYYVENKYIDVNKLKLEKLYASK